MSVHHRVHRQRLSRERSTAALALFALMVFIAAMGVVLAISFAPNPSLLFGGNAAPSARKLVESRIAGHTFRIPELLLARLDKPLLGETNSIDLKIPWPFDPENAAPAAMDGEGVVLIAISARGAAQTHEELFREIYPVYLEEGQMAGAFAFLKFKPDSPYHDSELLVDRRPAPPAVIRCDTRPSALGPVLCERLKIRSGDLLVRISFPRDAAADWRAIDDKVEAVLAAAAR